MAQRSGFFQDDGGDRQYTADQFANKFRLRETNGVFVQDSQTLTTELQVTANDTNLNVSVAIGGMNIQGYDYEVYSSAETLAIEAGDSLNPRIDRVVVKLDLDNGVRAALLEVKKGTPSATPTPPSLTQTGAVWEISLAQILVPQSASLILNSNVTDERTPAEPRLKTAELTELDVVLFSQVFS
jgi:hypothetical protein